MKLVWQRNHLLPRALQRFFVLCSLFVLSGCSEKNRETPPPVALESVQEENKLIDETYLLANTDLTEQDFEDVDIPDFIATWNLTAGSLQTLDVEACLSAYKKAKGVASQEPDTAALFEVPLKALPQDNVKAISVLVFRMQQASQTQIMFDFTQQKLYGTRDAQMVERRSLTDDDQICLREWIEQEDIAGLQTEFSGSMKSEWPYRWDLVIVLEDGSTAHYRGDRAAPEAISNLPDDWCSWMINEEYLIQNTSLTRSDLSGVSVADFVSSQHLTPDFVDSNRDSMQDLLEVYRRKS